MKEKEINKLERENILENRLYDQGHDIHDRIWSVAEYFGQYSKKLVKGLNLDNQDKMTLLGDISDKNPHISCDQLLNQLKRLGYIEIVNDKEEGKIPVLMAEGVDFYIEPHRVGKRDYCGMDTYLVVSKEVEEKLQEYCDKVLKRINRKCK